MINYHKNTIESSKEFLKSMGMESRQNSRKDVVMKKIDVSATESYDEIFPNKKSMRSDKDIETSNAFYGQLWNSSKYVILGLAFIFALQIYVLPIFENLIAEVALGIFALIKISLIVGLTFNQLAKIIGQSHLLSHILVLFGFLITIIILSFSVDYYAHYVINPSSFKISNMDATGGFLLYFEMLYFSTITFSSVGYGDIVPTSMLSKCVTMLEIAIRFFVLVFGIANINQIKIDN